MPKKDPSKQFHDKVKNLLKRAGFTIEKSDYYAPGPDIVARAENQRIIVQCRCAETQGKTYSGLEHLIDEYSTKVKKEKARVAILALSKYTIPEKYQDPGERDRILRQGKVVIWDDTAIDYYRRSVNALGTYAKYPLFGDLNIKKKFGDPEIVPAMEITQGDRKFFVFKISPDKLLRIAYVFRKWYSATGAGYQRMLTPQRLKKDIAEEFLDLPGAILPNVIICAFESEVQFDEVSKSLTIPMKYASAWIIDGQHRLYAFCHVKDPAKRQEFILPCVGFNVEGIPQSFLKREEQGKLFVDINEKAKRLRQLLLLDLYEQIGVPDRRVDIVKELAKTEAFKNGIQFREDQKREITLPTFARTAPIEKLVKDHGIISYWYGAKRDTKKVPQEYCLKILSKYFSIVSEVFASEWKKPDTYILATNIGIRGLLRILEEVLKYSNGLRDESKAKACIAALKGFQLRKSALKGMYYGEGGANLLEKKWIQKIQTKIHDFGPQAKVDEKVIMPGQESLAKSFIEEYLSNFEGEVVGELMYIDKTTFSYLHSIPLACGIKLIVVGIKDGEKCYEEAKKLAENRSYLHIIQIRDMEHPKRAFHHERWLADKNYKLDLSKDLKDDALGKNMHTISVRDKPWLSQAYVMFEELWKADQAELEKLLGANFAKEKWFSSE